MTSGNSLGWSRRVAMREGALILGFAAVMALGTGASVSAHEAASAMFDGEYTGTATPNNGPFANCLYLMNPIMTIEAPQVTIRI